MMKTPLQQLNRPLLAWYDEHRRYLPWREEISPYRTWVSEIMLQQTRVGTVIPYFERFMARYPTVPALAAADTGELLKCWEGLGYYSRVRNLQKAAQKIETDFAGNFPQTYEELLTLPGIGDYTAGAILSIAFGRKVPAVDGNVLRVVSRLTDSHADVLDAKVRAAVRAQVAETMSTDRPGAYNQALMDLGATVCLPSGAPLCESCPARQFCAGFLAGEAEKLPVRSKKPPKRVEKMTVFVLWQAGKVALTRRSDTGLLASLWEYPHVSGTLDESAAAAVAASWGLEIKTWHRQLTARHEFTHIRWEMTGYLLDVSGSGREDWRWASAQDRQGMAIPSAFSKFTAEVDKREEEN
jgi:A/G-specific adenine glycosylase